MNNITIYNYGTVNICNADAINEAKDALLSKLYYARNKETMGGYQAWLELLDMYYAFDWKGMYNRIKSCKGKGGKTRHECLKCLATIMGGKI